MDLWQAIAGLITFNVAVGWYLLNRVKSLEKDRDILRAADLEDKNKQIGVLTERLTVAEVKANKVPGLEKHITTLLTQMEDMQEWKESAEKKLEERDATIERQVAEIDRLKGQNNSLFEANKALQTEVRTYEKAFTWMGIQRETMEHIETDDLTDSAAKIAEKSNHQNALGGAMGNQTTTDTQEKP
jgi:chromosome segregation ATPase